MRAYYFAALIAVTALTGCREIVRELLKEDGDRPSADPAAAPPPPAAPTPPPPPDDRPPKAATTATATATTKKTTAAPTVAPTCANVCEKSLKCMNGYDAKEQNDCVTSCEGGKPDPARFAKLLQMDCNTLVANLKGGGGNSGANKRASVRRVLLPARRPGASLGLRLGLKRAKNDATSTP